MSTRAAVLLQVAYAVAAALLLALARISPPPGRIGDLAAAPIGVAVAAALYVAVARGRSLPRHRLAAFAVPAGATEEVVWRWGVLAGLAPEVGWLAALVLSSVGFAYRHTQGEGLVRYLALGFGFGTVFVATGRLLAAVAAHAAYNALVLARSRA